MTPRETRQNDVLGPLAEHVLEHGLAAASLRPLAAAAGTSDRMLLYYFGDKESLIGAVLARIAADMLLRLERALPDASTRPFASLLADLWSAAASPELRPYMVVWLEAATLSARGIEPYRTVSSQIVQGFLDWATARLEEPNPIERSKQAADLLTRIDGAMLMDVLGRRDIADAAMTSSRV